MRVKSIIEAALRRFPPLYRFGSRVYHRLNPEFRTLSPGAPAAIKEALELTRTDPDASSFAGDYYEFGIFRGYTFLQAGQAMDELGFGEMRMYGFDSFEGLPAPEGVDSVDTRFFEGQFACSREDVEKNLREHGMNMDRATLVQGFYEDSLTAELREQHAFKPVSVALLDCDYYSSTKVALEWLDPYIVSGSILLFDDWFSYDSEDLGQQKAFDEFLSAHANLRAEHLSDFQHNGRGFIVRTSA